MSVVTLVQALGEREYIELAAAVGLLWLLIALITRPKTYYFVRHGRTTLNETHVKQGADGELAPAGIKQAEHLGETLEHMGIGAIYSSPYQRARETAEIIKTYVKRRITLTPLLAERRNASTVIGKRTDDPEVEALVAHTDLSYHDDTYRYADEENFAELKKRALKALRYLAQRPEHRVCVVTHHAVLHMMLSTMIAGKSLTSVDYVKLSFFNPAENGGITICAYRPWRNFWTGRGWEIRTYNH